MDRKSITGRANNNMNTESTISGVYNNTDTKFDVGELDGVINNIDAELNMSGLGELGEFGGVNKIA